MGYIKRTTPDMHNIVILYDTHENYPWQLPIPWKMKRRHLQTGDYTIEGYEHLIAIEKKSGISELLTDLSGRDRVRFEKTLLRMSAFPFKCIVIEDDYSAASLAFDLLKKKSKGKARVTPASLQCFLAKMMFQYGIPVFFIGPPDMRSRNDMTLVWLFKIACEQAFNYKGKRHASKKKT